MTDQTEAPDHINIVFDGPPSNPAPRFIEVEDPAGKSIRAGEWVERPDGYWELQISLADLARPPQELVEEVRERAQQLERLESAAGGGFRYDADLLIEVLAWMEAQNG